MKRCMQWAALLYPASWRARYAVEFEALLEDAELRWADFWDIVRGALRMQMKVWTFWKVAGTCGLAGLAIATVVALRTPNLYVSTAVLRVTPEQSPEVVGEQLNQIQRKVLSRASLTEMIVHGDLYKRDRASRPLEDIVQDMRRSIQLQPVAGNPTAFSIAFQYGDPVKAQAGTRGLVTRFTQGMPAVQGSTLELLDPASLPRQPFEPKRPVWIGLGLVLGLAAGSVLFGIGKWPKVALTGFGTAFVVLIGAYFVPDRFMSIGVLRGADQGAVRLVAQADTDPAFLRSLIEGPLHLYPGMPIEQAVAEMRNHDIRIHQLEVPGGGKAYTAAIEFQYTDESHGFALFRRHDRYKAQAVVQEMVGHAIGAYLRSGQAGQSRGRLEVLDPASLPEHPLEPNRAAFVLLGLLAGLVVGVIWQVRGGPRTPAPEHA